MEIELSRIVKNFRKVDFIQPIYEAVNNSLEAGATKIEVNFSSEIELIDVGDRRITGAIIKDNGEGFNKRNIDSFNKYCSSLKKDSFGCKGVGRITWLKVFNNVVIESLVKEENKRISFVFDFNFDKSKIKAEEEKAIKENQTIIKFDNVTDLYYKRIASAHTKNLNKIKDERLKADGDLIKQKILYHLLPKLIFINDSGKQFNIAITMDSEPNKKFIITNHDLPKMESLSFFVKSNTDDSNKEFNLLYQIFKDGKGESRNYYCANQRTVKEFDKKEIDITLPENGSSLMLLSSTYLDETVNDERTDFYIKAKETTITEPFSWRDINYNLRKRLTVVVNDHYPNLLKEKEAAANSLSQDYPHLSKYIKPMDNICIGELNENKIIKEALKQYEDDKERIREDFKKLISNNVQGEKEKIYQEYITMSERISELNSQELAEYILYRQKIIEILKKLNADNSKVEKFLHNLFMKRFTDSSGTNYKDCNLWLIDDKYMSYLYAASDKTIKNICHKIEEKNKVLFKESKKPDMTIFYSSEVENYKDVIVVEFKAVGANEDEKNKAIWELPRNIDIIKKNICNINICWGYVITGIDDDLANMLKTEGYNPLFSNKGDKAIYYKYYDTLKAHLYFISTDAIVNDADIRNKTFLDILRKGSKE